MFLVVKVIQVSLVLERKRSDQQKNEKKKNSRQKRVSLGFFLCKVTLIPKHHTSPHTSLLLTLLIYFTYFVVRVTNTTTRPWAKQEVRK
jgi:Na+-transporting methylmalonyl-CoA/oxaloacetate decarboxylase gamma subunit